MVPMARLSETQAKGAERGLARDVARISRRVRKMSEEARRAAVDVHRAVRKNGSGGGRLAALSSSEESDGVGRGATEGLSGERWGGCPSGAGMCLTARQRLESHLMIAAKQ